MAARVSLCLHVDSEQLPSCMQTPGAVNQLVMAIEVYATTPFCALNGSCPVHGRKNSPLRGFLDITQNQSVRIGRKFEETNPYTPPDLFRRFRDLNFDEICGEKHK